MKTGIIIFCIGLIISILGWTGVFSSEGLTNGAITLVLGYPLILIGLVVIILKLMKKNK